MDKHLRNIKKALLISLFLTGITYIQSREVHAQVSADILVTDSAGCSPCTIHFTNNGSTGGDYAYKWYFTSRDSSVLEDPEFTFNSGGTYDVILIVTNTSTSETAEAHQEIVVTQTPSANLNFNLDNACVNGDIEFRTGYSNRDSAFWDFGDGTISKNESNYQYHAYTANGSYQLQYITYYGELVCSDTSAYTIDVNGPVADFTINPTEACKGDEITFTMEAIADVDTFSWEWDDGATSPDNPAIHVFDTLGYISARLYVSGVAGNCVIQDTFYIHEVLADFTYSDIRCEQDPVLFFNQSLGSDLNTWEFDDGNVVLTRDASHTFEPGDHIVKLTVQNIENCKDSIEKVVTVYALPDIVMGEDITICPGVGGQITVEGGDIVQWEPAWGLDDPTSFQPIATPESDTLYTATITDTATHCMNSGELSVALQEGFITGMISVYPVDTSIIIGETVQLHVFDSLANEREISYNWTPDVQISCIDCADPVVQPLTSTTYTLEVSDDNQCFISETFEFSIEVTEEYRIGLPEAFTPNGDDINETIKVDGWGIKELLEFRIYNRGGKEVFYTTDINAAWDGTWEGKPQMTGTYQYLVRAIMWDDNETILRGTFTLLR